VLQTDEQKRVAVLVNAVVDISLVSEEVEQLIFEHAVMIIDRALDDILPQLFKEFLRDREKGIDKDQARRFGDRLVKSLNKKVDLPYLTEAEEARLIRTVVDPIIKGMIQGKRLDDILPLLPKPQ
jgi:hypothetical protein